MEKLKTNIYSLAFGLNGVGKIDGKVCFVKGALPGEDVVFGVVKDHGRYIEGEVLEVEEPSQYRIEPECPYYDKCGGCQGQHMAYEEELRYKQEQVVELLRRLGGVEDPVCLDIEPSKEEYRYRSSITLHRKRGVLGFFGVDGKTVIPIEACLLAEESINKEIPGIDRAGGKDNVTLKADNKGRIWSSERMGERFFLDTFRNFDMYFSPKSFSQANRYISEKIVEELEGWIGAVDNDTAVFDPYCGVGFFTFLLKGDYGIRVGMDESRVAIDCAKTTAKKHEAGNIKFYRGKAEEKFLDLFERAKLKKNILFLDPPRKGGEKGFLNRIKENKGFDKVYYLSCDPARIARDIKVLTEGSGLVLKRVKPFDMFPRTKHIEVLAEFVRE